MKILARTISWLALAGTIAPPLLFFADAATLDQVKTWMGAATVVWFVATPFWMDKR
jgi:hypothetical protein